MSEIEKLPSTLQSVSDVDPVRDGEASQMAFMARRRQLAKLGFGAPVLATLASRPVFAAPCLSNMMSGNLSHPNRGNCAKGWSQEAGDSGLRRRRTACRCAGASARR